MTTSDGRWPDRQTRLERAQRGIFDDTMDAVPIYDLEEWEVLGDTPPANTQTEHIERRERPRLGA